jgi:hypothetical protein
MQDGSTSEDITSEAGGLRAQNEAQHVGADKTNTGDANHAIALPAPPRPMLV